MSRTRIVGGKLTKQTKEAHYMFSDENISTLSLKKIQEEGKEDGILHGTAKIYEPWKSMPRHDWYHCLFAGTVNKKVSISDLGINIEVEMCLTAISSVIRYEGYDLYSKDEYKFHNWLYILNVFMNNRGELVEGAMDVITYKAERQVGSVERNIEKDKTSNAPIFQKTIYKLKSKGKDLHDEVFLDKKFVFTNGMERGIDYQDNSNESSIFYNLLGNFLREASRFNRRSDVSYVIAGTESAETFLSSFNDNADKISLAVDSPLLSLAFEKYKGASLFKETFGFFTYFTGGREDVAILYEKVNNLRGPIQLTEIQCARNNGKDKLIESEHYLLTEDFSELGEVFQSTNKKLKKDE